MMQPIDFADANTGCVEYQDAARRDMKSRRRARFPERRRAKRTNRLTGNCPQW